VQPLEGAAVGDRVVAVFLDKRPEWHETGNMKNSVLRCCRWSLCSHRRARRSRPYGSGGFCREYHTFSN